jgi:MSHA biogenesis protein MshN
MSLINQMLRDLDRREASTAERSGLSGQVRALPPPRRSSWPRLTLVLAGAVGVLALAVGIMQLVESQPWHYAGPATSAPKVAMAPPAPSPPPVTSPGAMPSPMPSLIVPMPSVKAAAKAPPLPVPRQETPDKGSVPAEPRPTPGVADPAPTSSVPPAVVAEPAAAIEKRPLGQTGAEGAEAEYRQGVAAYRQGQLAEAIARFRNALAADSHHAAARQALLSTLMAERRWAEAQTVASEGLALDAAQPGWAMTLARLQFEQGQLAEAERTMAAHRRYGERSPDYLAFHGLLLEKLDRRDEARAAFLKARESGKLSPELAEAIEQRLR